MHQEKNIPLASLLTDQRKQRIEQVLDWRTYHIAIALEDIFQSQNASACIRTCECFGIQRIFTIENRNPFTVNPDVVVGATKWVDVERFRTPEKDNTVECISQLKKFGYRVIATTLEQGSTDIRELSIEQPLALLFGTELTGLSATAIEMADEKVHLPMFGFTESYNISVSVALALSELVHRLHKSSVNWRLTDDQRKKLRERWYEQHIRR